MVARSQEGGSVPRRVARSQEGGSVPRIGFGQKKAYTYLFVDTLSLGAQHSGTKFARCFAPCSLSADVALRSAKIYVTPILRCAIPYMLSALYWWTFYLLYIFPDALRMGLFRLFVGL